MKRITILACAVALLCVLVMTGGVARAEDMKPHVPTDEELAEALAQFKVDMKARGVPKEDLVSQRNWAMKKIAPLQHPDVIEILAKFTKNRNGDLRTLALIYLGDQTKNPHLAAKPILAAMKKHRRDNGVLMTGLQSLCMLKYLGARKEIRALMNHKEFSIKKMAIAAVGDIGDLRMLKEILRLLGVDVDATSSQAESTNKDGGKSDAPSAPGGPSSSGPDAGGGSEGGDGEAAEPGYSWGGVDVFVPTGEDAAKAVSEAQEKNRSAAEAAARGGRSSGGGTATRAPSSPTAPTPASTPAGGAGSGSGASSTRGQGATQRGASELIPTILVALKKLTGRKFKEPDEVKTWLVANSATIRAKQTELDETEKAQRAVRK